MYGFGCFCLLGFVIHVTYYYIDPHLINGTVEIHLIILTVRFSYSCENRRAVKDVVAVLECAVRTLTTHCTALHRYDKISNHTSCVINTGEMIVIAKTGPEFSSDIAGDGPVKSMRLLQKAKIPKEVCNVNSCSSYAIL